MNNFKAILIAAIVFANQVVPVHVQVARASAQAPDAPSETTQVVSSEVLSSLPTATQHVTLRSIVIGQAAAPAQDTRSLQAIVADMVTERFGAAAVSKVEYIIRHESNWEVTAKNPNSGAYGIGQSLPASKMAAYGADYLTNGATQAEWLMDYIADRYGTPQAAYSHWLTYHWY